MEPNTVLIQNYTSNDKSTLLNLFDLNTPEYFAATEKLDFEQYLENEIQLYFTISLDNKIVGCGGINFENEQTIGIISWDMIHPDYQGKSLGSRLIKHRIAVLNSIPTVNKIIVRTSQITYQFYEKHGFKIENKVPNYWAEGFDLYFMEYEHCVSS